MPDDFSDAPVLTIKIGGSPASDELLNDVAELVINSDLHLPGMFTIRLEDRELTWSGGTLLALGKEVEISAQARKQGTETGSKGVIIKGEITALEPEFSDDGQIWLTVRGYDKGHRLHRGKKTRTFLQTKDSDVVSTIAGEVGLSADADATSVTYPYLLQNNQTNMEFLQERARRIGYWVYVDGAAGKLCFKKAATPDRGSGPTLTWGNNLYSFSPRLSSAHQADKIKVIGWDSKTKAAIVGEFTPTAPANQAGQTAAGGAAAKTAFSGSAEAIIMNEPVITVDEAKALAEGLGQQLSRNFLWAEGKCQGDPTVKAGAVVTIVLRGGGLTADAKFGGKYLVTSATHIYNGTEFYTQFSITGQDPNTFGALLGAEPPAATRVPGVVTGVVTNAKDPDKLGRVKVKFPWMGTPEIESDWVRLSSPMAGAQRGFMALPEVNDEVLVAFEQGNPDFPFVVGGLWNNTDKPPVGNDVAVASDGKVVQRIFKTRAGHIILLDDTQGSELIKIVDKTGKNSVVIDSASNAITLTTDGPISLEAPKGDITIKGKNVNIESQQNTSIKATQNITMEATTNLGLKGTAGAKLEGATVDVKASGAGTFDGGGMATIKGGMVKIN
jgi:uncharacterized protein involved in type VI secretion and phage assembly